MLIRLFGKTLERKFALLFCFGGLLSFNFSCVKSKTVENSNKSNHSIVRVKENTPERKLSPNASLFERNLPAEIALPNENDEVSKRILKDYGAVFVAQGDIVVPTKIIFTDEEDCLAWQSKAAVRRESFGGIEIELQTAAMNDLIAARDEMRGKNLNVTARGTWAARRSYRDTEKIWSTRITPGLVFWTRRGKLSPNEAARIRTLAPVEQIAEILRLESKGMFFSKGFSKSVLYSATPPGASQHLSMLAVDINENESTAVRSILAKHGWFQTVALDVPHFTYLGVSEDKLPALGLKKVVKDNRIYWIPEV